MNIFNFIFLVRVFVFLFLKVEICFNRIISICSIGIRVNLILDLDLYLKVNLMKFVRFSVMIFRVDKNVKMLSIV